MYMKSALDFARRTPGLVMLGAAAAGAAFAAAEDITDNKTGTNSSLVKMMAKKYMMASNAVVFCDESAPKIVPRRIDFDNLLFGTTHTTFEVRYGGDNDVDAYMQAVEASHPDKAVFALFVADKTNGKSWCGDCRRAEPVLADVFNSHWRDVIVVVFDVDRQAYRHPSKQYPYRVHPEVQLKCVPTLHA